jgi:hypothetical protein
VNAQTLQNGLGYQEKKGSWPKIGSMSPFEMLRGSRGLELIV